MNKLSKLAFIAATAVMAASAMAQSVPASRQATNDNWVNGTGEYVWMNGTNELCWRDAFWTPATANAKCDGALVAQAPTPPAPPAPVAPAITSQKITYQADTLFDFDKAILKPAGKEKLDDLASKIQGLNLEVVVATGYTDRIGSDKYNDRLSLRRAQAVKAYLVSKGIEANRIYTEGKGKRNPVTTGCNQKNRKQLIACLAPDRRVEVEVVGTSKQ
ncbi:MULTISPECIES: outer membrane protein OmpA [Paraburkholderia]|jgi:OOP family OmpA-OmpF porin|uniref:OmpA-OmpF porin, OOP family n=7 Tax=Paraburkholderia TaxID=1822464 RepID=A0A7Z7FGF1_9BURK|nr:MULTISPECIES: OmpA family protein [Paraburkholderia]EUC17318.1 OmpA/MotB domain protein [Burkholderia sp. BT03]SKC71289.1 OmpA-OmpF porin, OOP family [Burkholderia sp. CF099]SOE55040.1 OmpA-OmpF porin, OOP family [Burkholderia sp. YR290]BEU20656.1 OmpA family protein [Paraburkholderia sp. 22B1P]ALL66043.1 Outer membrane protein A precursor [Paraburkholderia caribensis MBA4]